MFALGEVSLAHLHSGSVSVRVRMGQIWFLKGKSGVDQESYNRKARCFTELFQVVFHSPLRTAVEVQVISNQTGGGGGGRWGERASWTLAPADLIHTTCLINAPGHMAAASDLLLGIQRFPREPLLLPQKLLNK